VNDGRNVVLLKDDVVKISDGLVGHKWILWLVLQLKKGRN
jgi:hypothetical protein